MKDKKIISILGAGAMGWAIAYIISSYRRGQVKLWDRDPELILCARKTRQNPKNSNSEIIMPNDVLLLADLEETLIASDLLILAIPSFAVREICQRLACFSLPPILMISKGMEEDTSLLPFQIVKAVLGKRDILHLTGTGYGKEVHKEIPVTEVLASPNQDLLAECKAILETDWLTIQTTTDLLGVQLAGALKNVLVVGIGMAMTANDGDPENRERLILAGVEDMIRLGKSMGAKEETFWGPAGKGDLEISADPQSRNYQLGKALVDQGLEQVRRGLKEKGITFEGFHTAFATYRLAQRYGVKMPVINEVYDVIYTGKNPRLAARNITQLIQTVAVKR